jgi:4-carboxymuconolactone decarboxylase
MARLPDTLGALGPDARRVYDKIVAKRGVIQGPYAALMHHPALAERVGDLGELLRFDSTVPGDIRELVILMTARAASQPFEWVMHVPIAQRAGLPQDVIERIKVQGDVSGFPPRYAGAARIIQHVLARESLPASLQEAVAADLGVAGLLELVVLAGYYQMIAGVLFAFDAPLPEGIPAPF